MEKVLKTNIPPIGTYNWHANVFSLLWDKPETKPWFYSNYIQLYCLNERNWGERPFFDFFIVTRKSVADSCPWIRYSVLDKKFIQEICPDTITLLLAAINTNNYVYVALDTFYLSAFSQSFSKYHGAHEVLIFGYDDTNRIFHIADFINGKYIFTTASFTEVEKAYINVENPPGHLPGVELFSFNQNASYKFDPIKVKRTLQEFIEGTNSSIAFSTMFNPNDYHYGININNALINYLNQLINREKSPDRRPFHLIWEHKAFMLERLHYMHENGFLGNYEECKRLYKELEQLSLVNRNLFLKYLVNNSTVVLENLIRRIEVLIEKELVATQEVIQNIILK